MSGLSLVNSTSNGDMSSTINGAGSGAVELSDSGRALKLQTDSPHLVSMGGDRLSTSVTLHPIPQGSQKKTKLFIPLYFNWPSFVVFRSNRLIKNIENTFYDY